MGLLYCVMFNVLSQITLKVKFLRNEEQHCLLPSPVDEFTCVHSKNALLTHILSALFSSTPVLFSCTPFGTKSYLNKILCYGKRWERPLVLFSCTPFGTKSYLNKILCYGKRWERPLVLFSCTPFGTKSYLNKILCYGKRWEQPLVLFSCTPFGTKSYLNKILCYGKRWERPLLISCNY